MLETTTSNPAPAGNGWHDDESGKPSRVMVVDDDTVNLMLLTEILRSENYQVHSASSPAQALATVGTFLPHVALFDVMMPEMDGFALCQRLKAIPAVADTPVIFITALSDMDSKVKAFASGGADIVSKPFHREEVLARVKAQVQLRLQHFRLVRHAERLEALVDRRTRMLLHSDRLSTIGTMTAMIIHELNSPLSVVSGNLALAQDRWREIQAVLESSTDRALIARVLQLAPLLAEILTDAHDGAHRLVDILSELRTYTRRQGGLERSACSLKALIDRAVHILHPRLYPRFTVQVSVPDDLTLMCDLQKMEQVLINLLSNSIDAAERGTITFTAARADEGEGVILRYRDTGPDIPAEVRARMFEPFFTTKSPEHGTGLGMTIVREILRQHGATIVLDDSTGSGVGFEIRLNPGGQAAETNRHNGGVTAT